MVLKYFHFREIISPDNDPFYATGLFLYPQNKMKTLVFWCFQEVCEETSGIKRLNYIFYLTSANFCNAKKNF